MGEAKDGSSSWVDQTIPTGLVKAALSMKPVRCGSLRNMAFWVTAGVVGDGDASTSGGTAVGLGAAVLRVSVGDMVTVGCGVSVAVGICVAVAVAVAEGVGVLVDVGSIVGVGVGWAVSVAVGVAVGGVVAVSVGVDVLVFDG